MIRHFFFIILAASLPVSIGWADPVSSTPVATEKLPLERLIQGPDIWERSASSFETAFKHHGMQWLSAQHDRARFFGQHLGLWDQRIKPVEIVVQFQNDRPQAIEISIFNRADSKQAFTDDKQFVGFAEELQELLATTLELKSEARGGDHSSIIKTPGWLFRGEETAYLLEYSFQRAMRSRGQPFQPEFIRLRVAKVHQDESTATVSRGALTSRVSKEANGDVVIHDVPMVDQGPKGYCAVAATERLMRYYGMEVDQHEIAQLAGSEAALGTNPEKMMDELRSKQGRLKLRIRDLERLEYRDYQKMIRNYNRLARTADAPSLPENGMIEVAKIFAQADPEVLKETRTVKDRSGFGRFERTIQARIDSGVPLLWSVVLGVFAEPQIPQAAGGHMRLIIGYNTQAKEILFSDTWGAGHELKRMPLDHAWTITTGLGLIEPSK